MLFEVVDNKVTIGECNYDSLSTCLTNKLIG